MRWINYREATMPSLGVTVERQGIGCSPTCTASGPHAAVHTPATERSSSEGRLLSGASQVCPHSCPCLPPVVRFASGAASSRSAVRRTQAYGHTRKTARGSDAKRRELLPPGKIPPQFRGGLFDASASASASESNRTSLPWQGRHLD